MTIRPAALALVAALLAVGLASCSGEEPQPVIVSRDRVSVVNMTGAAWTDVDVWLNYHYRAQARRLEPNQRLDVPTGFFIAAYGQRFDGRKQAPTTVQVMARGADGKPVEVRWGKGPWR
jgi:hypothetical protein